MFVKHTPIAGHMEKFHFHDLPFESGVHHIWGPDVGDPHDHPLSFSSMILKGGYVEEVFSVHTGLSTRFWRRPGDRFMVYKDHIHRIIELLEPTVLTFAEYGPIEQQWGHYQWRDGVPWKSVGASNIWHKVVI